MKAQKLGLVLGINMAAACLVMQGCKATKPGKPVPSTPERPVITVTPAAPRTTPVVAPVTEPTVEPAQPTVTPTPTYVVADQPSVSRPSSVRKVKALPPTPAPKPPKPPKKPKTKPAAATTLAPAAQQPAATTTEYVVKPGDTLFLISKRTNYRQDAIVAANPGLKPDRLRVGQKIKMPGAIAAPSVAKAATKADAKSAAKDKDGKVLPAAAPAPAAADTKPPVKTKSGYVPYEGPTKDYVVKNGDSLGKIASECGITIRALKALNGLQKDNLRVGQKLKIPTEKQVASAKKAPAAAKTAPAAAAKGAPAPAPAAKKDPAVKEAAVTATAPEAKESPAPAKPAEAAPAAVAAPPAEEAKPAEAPAVRTHVVKEGEDLVNIAIGYTVSPSAIMDLNDLKPSDEIKPGQVLKLPPNAKVNQ